MITLTKATIHKYKCIENTQSFDVDAFELTLEDADVENGIISADNGFASSGNFEGLEDPERRLK